MRDERAFVTAVKHLASASVLAAEAILRRQPDVIFINSESSEFYQACCPDERVMAIADFENERRFMALDLVYGHEPRRDVRDYLFRHGLSPDEYAWFMNRDVVNRCIVGLDYYDWNEKVINSEGRVESLGELFGW
jgi:hypothetical protein